jgi:para-nitrobenzyl esterase
MVWIHGGAFRFGSGFQAYYDGAEFAYEAFADSVFTGPARDMAMSAMEHGNSAYVYHFDYRKTSSESVADGAHHGWEIPFVFKNLSAAPALAGDESNVDDMNRLADTMHSYWINFAQYGDPNFGKMAPWPAIQDGNFEKTMVFKNQGSHTETNFRKPQLDLQYELYQARLKKADKG